MPAGNTENVDQNMESLFSKIDEVISQAKKGKCSKQEKREKYHGVTAKVKDGKLVLHVTCTTSHHGKLFIREVEIKINENKQEGLPSTHKGRAKNHNDKWVYTLPHKYTDVLKSLCEQVKNMKTPELHPGGVQMREVRRELLGTSQAANYITDNTQFSQSTTSSGVLPQQKSTSTTTRMTSIDKKTSTSTESSTSLDLTVRENKVNTSTTEDSTEMFPIKEDPQTDNSSRVEDISTSTPYSTLKSSPTSGTALRRRGIIPVLLIASQPAHLIPH